MQRWEYNATLMSADAEVQRDYLRQRWPDLKLEKNSPNALIPAFDEYGAAGWELVSMQPVVAGRNHDIKVHEGTGTEWSAVYLCTFKRPLDSA